MGGLQPDLELRDGVSTFSLDENGADELSFDTEDLSGGTQVAPPPKKSTWV